MNPLSASAVYAALKEIIDPEMGCNIVDLGLIYSLSVDGSQVQVAMSLSSPSCPMSEYLLEGVRSAVFQVPGVTEAQVLLVWDPPWNPGMISEQGRRELEKHA